MTTTPVPANVRGTKRNSRGGRRTGGTFLKRQVRLRSDCKCRNKYRESLWCYWHYNSELGRSARLRWLNTRWYDDRGNKRKSTSLCWKWRSSPKCHSIFGSVRSYSIRSQGRSCHLRLRRRGVYIPNTSRRGRPSSHIPVVIVNKMERTILANTGYGTETSVEWPNTWLNWPFLNILSKTVLWI